MITMNEIFLQNGKRIWLTVTSVRKFRICTNHPDVKIIRDDNNNFVEMKFSDLFSFKKGDKIVIKDSKNYITFILNDIFSISNTHYDGIEQKINKTCIFILPLLGYNHIHFDYGYHLYNGYISADYKFIYIQYKFTKTDTYLDLEETLQKHPMYIEFFDLNKEFVVFKFKLDDKYHSTIDNIIKGKYSAIKEDTKMQILAFHGLPKASELGGVLFKDENYKKMLESKLGVRIPDSIDLMSRSTKEEEIWNYQNTFQETGMIT